MDPEDTNLLNCSQDPFTKDPFANEFDPRDQDKEVEDSA